MPSFDLNSDETLVSAPTEGTVEDLFATFADDDDPADPSNESENGNRGTSIPGSSQSFAQTAQYKIEQDAQQATAALVSIKTELDEAGLLEKPEVQQQIEQLLGLVQGVHQGFRGQVSATIQQQFKTIRQQVKAISDRMNQVPDLDEALQLTADTVKKLLRVERTLIFQFTSEDQGKVITEAMSVGWTPTLSESLSESLPAVLFGLRTATQYQRQQGCSIDNTGRFSASPYQRQLFEKFQVKSSLAIPIIVEQNVWGLLVVQQCNKARQWQETDVVLVSQLVEALTLKLLPTKLMERLATSQKREQAIGEIINRILQSSDLTSILQNATQELRRLIQCDRVVVYKFYPDWSGEIVAESVAAGWKSLLQEQKNDSTIKTSLMDADQCVVKTFGSPAQLDPDTYLKDTQGGMYAKGAQYRQVDDVQAAGFPPCYLDTLENRFQARAYINAPIFNRGQLWGLLAVYQCSGARQWTEDEVKSLVEVVRPLGLALQQAEYTNQLTKTVQREQTLSHLISQIRQTTDLDKIFSNATQELRRLMKIERVTIYKFRDDFFGDFVSESVTGDFPKLVGSGWEDPYLNEHQGGRFHDNLPLVVDDVHEGELLWENNQLNLKAPKKPLTDCHIEALEFYQVKSCAVVSIFKGNELWGLLSAFHNTEIRSWETEEVQLLMQVAKQIGFVIQEVGYVNQLTKTVQREQTLSHLISQIRQTTDLDKIFSNATQELRRFMKIERVTIYKFRDDFFGDFVNESVTGDFPKLVGSSWEDPYLNEHQGGRFHDNLPLVVDDVHEGELLWENNQLNPKAPKKPLTDCHIEALEFYQVRSCAVVSIFKGNKLWGLLSAFHNTEIRSWETEEVQLLMQVAKQIGFAIQEIDYANQLTKTVQREQTLSHLISRILNSTDETTMFRFVTQELRTLIKCDRIGVYRFLPDWSGKFVAESVASGWVPLVGPGIETVWEDTHLQETEGGRYKDQESFVVNDIYKVGHAQCHIDILEQFQVKAYMIAPILYQGKLWGLLGAYQNSGTRAWQPEDIQVLDQIGVQMGVALQEMYATTLLRQQSKREQTIAKIASQILKTTDDPKTLYNSTVRDVRRYLNADRVGVFEFYPDAGYDDGEFIAEDVVKEFPSAIAAKIHDHCFGDQFANKYADGRIQAVADIYNADLSDCHIDVLSQFEIRANLIVPLLNGSQLWGLLCVHQCREPREWKEDEIDFLKQIASQLSLAYAQFAQRNQLNQQTEILTATTDRTVAYNKLTYRVAQRVILQIQEGETADPVFRLVTQELRRQLKTDRIAIYQFNPDWSGEFIVEDVAGDYPKLVGTDLAIVRDTYLQENQGGRYKNGESYRVDDIYTIGHSDCHIELLETWEAKAYMLAPIFTGDKLWGIIGAYQNDGPRHWEDYEVELLAQMGVQLGIAVQQSISEEKLRRQSQELAETAARDKAARESLQQQIVQMLMAVRPALDGDLTVRAPVSEDAVGTVADAYNNTIQSLRQLVTQVKQAANQVGNTSQESSGAISQLSQQTQNELQQVTQALKQLQAMVDATQSVSANAKQVESAVQQANQTVQQGDSAMNQTVEGILTIRETVSEATKKIKRLSESSQKISKVVSLISNFTTQTQLLALNAAIEATRAGEYGRGFAVVADEVRSLAQQSAEATGEIEKLVQDIQSETSAVSTAMDTGIQQVVEGTTLVNQTRQSLNAIVAATASISDLVKGITQSTQAQIQQSDSVTQAMNDVAAIAQKTTTDSAQISSSFQELLATAEALQTSVGRFKVD